MRIRFCGAVIYGDVAAGDGGGGMGQNEVENPRPCLLEEAAMELLCGPLHIRRTT